MKTRKIVSICNIVIAFLCAVSILGYFLMPFWKINISYTMNAETLREIMLDEADSSIGDEEGDESDKSDDELVNKDDIMAGLDFNDIIGEDGVTLSLSLTLETSDILSSLSTDSKPLVKRILKKNVDNMVDQLEETLSTIVKKTLKTAVKSTFSDEIKEQVKNSMGLGTTDAQAKEELEKAGVTDEYINEKTNELVESLYKEGTTAESAANDTVDIVADALQKLQDSGNPDFKDMEMSNEDKAELKDAMVEVFKTFENEDGSLDIDAFISDFFAGLIGGGSSNGGEKTPESAEGQRGKIATNSIARMSDNWDDWDSSDSPDSANKDSSEEEMVNDLRQMLTNTLMEEMEDAVDTIAQVVSIISYVIIAMIVIWALPILKVLLKLKRRNNGIKVGLQVSVGAFPYVVCGLIPTLFADMLSNPPAMLAEIIGDGMKILSNFSLSVTTCTIIPFIIAIVLDLFVLFFYAKQRRTLRRECKAESNAPTMLTPAMDAEAAVAMDEVPVEDSNTNEDSAE